MDKRKCHYPEDIQTSKWFEDHPMRTQDKDIIVRAYQIIRNVCSLIQDAPEGFKFEDDVYQRNFKLQLALADFLEHEIGIYTLDTIGTLGFRRYTYAYPAYCSKIKTNGSNSFAFRIRLVDFPDIVVEAPTVLQAEDSAIKALECKMKSLRAEDKEMPMPTSIYSTGLDMCDELVIIKI